MALLLSGPTPSFAGNSGPAPAKTYASFSAKNFRLPAHLGVVEDAKIFNPAKTIVLIQDAHAIGDAQNSIRQITDYLSHQGIRFFGLEGADDFLDPVFFRTFPDQVRLENVFNQYVRSGEISGAAAGAVLNTGEQVFEGVENKDLYEEGIDLFLSGVARQQAEENSLRPIRAELLRLKQKMYSEQLLKLDALFSESENGSDLLEILKRINERFYDEKLLQKFPHLHAVLSEIRNEKTSVFRQELLLFASRLEKSAHTKKMPAQFYEKLQEFKAEQLSDALFAHYLTGMLPSLGFKIPPGLSQAAQHGRYLNQLRGEAFSEELKGYFLGLQNQMMEHQAQRLLSVLDREHFLLTKLVSLKLSRKEWEEIRARRKAGDFHGELAPVYEKLNNLHGRLLSQSHFSKFYRNAEAREAYLHKNLLNKMRARKVSAAAIVAGGFHTSGLIDQLKRDQISYLLISPAIQNIHSEEKYVDYMRGQVSWKSYFKNTDGWISVYDAFARAVRDKLFENSESVLLIKRWRDNLIRELAAQKRVETAGAYTVHLDELSVNRETLKKQWMQKVESFLLDLRQLKESGRLDSENFSRILNPSASPSMAVQWTAAYALQRNKKVPASWAVSAKRKIEKAKITSSEKPALTERSEARKSWVEANTPYVANHLIFAFQQEAGLPEHVLANLAKAEAQGIREYIELARKVIQDSVESAHFGAYSGIIMHLAEAYLRHKTETPDQGEQILDAIAGAAGDAVAEKVSETTLTGGLGALMPDLFEAWAAIGMKVSGIHPIWEGIKNTPTHNGAYAGGFGQFLRKQLNKTKYKYEIELNLGKLKDERHSQMAQILDDSSPLGHKKIFVEVYESKYPIHGSPQYYLDAYYLKDPSKPDSEDNRVRIFDEVYNDDYLWRDVHLAIYRQAGQRLILSLTGGRSDNVILIDNEVFTSIPAKLLPNAKRFTINHTVFRPGMYEPSEASYELLDFPEWMRGYIVKGNKISIADYAAEAYHQMTGVGLAEHFFALLRNIFPTSQHKLHGWNKNDIRSTNGVFFPRWESPLRRALIEQMKKQLAAKNPEWAGRLGIGEKEVVLPAEAYDRSFYEILLEKENRELLEKFKIRNELIAGYHRAKFLLWLRKKQNKKGASDWLDAIFPDAKGKHTRQEKEINRFFEDIEGVVKTGEDGDWEELETRSRDFVNRLLHDPVFANVRRQVPYKGPDKWIETFVLDAALEVFHEKGKEFTLKALREFGSRDEILTADEKYENSKESVRKFYWHQIIPAIEQAGEEKDASGKPAWLRIVENTYSIWREGLLQSVRGNMINGKEVAPIGGNFAEVWKALPATKAVKKYQGKLERKSEGDLEEPAAARAVIGGRTFDGDAANRFDKMKEIIGHLGIEDRATTIENYNYHEAKIIFQGVSDAMMLSDEFLEASATSMEKADANGGDVNGVYGGANPEIWAIRDKKTGKYIDIFNYEENGRLLTHDELVAKLKDGADSEWEITNGRLVQYAFVFNERGEPLEYETYIEKLKAGEAAFLNIKDHTYNHGQYEDAVRSRKWMVIKGILYEPGAKIPFQEVSSQEGGWRRPASASLKSALFQAKREAEKPKTRRDKYFETLRWSWKVNMVTSQTMAHAFLLENMLEGTEATKDLLENTKTKLSEFLDTATNQSDFEPLLNLFRTGSNAGFEWKTGSGLHDGVHSSSPGLFGVANGFRKIRTFGTDALRGQKAAESLLYHARAHHLFNYILEHMKNLPSWADPVRDKILQLSKDSAKSKKDSEKVELNLRALDLLDQFLLTVVGEVFEQYVSTTTQEVNAAIEMLLEDPLNNFEQTKYLSRYLDNHPKAIPLELTGGLRGFAFNISKNEGEEDFIFLGINAAKRPDYYSESDGIMKAAGLVFYNAKFNKYLLSGKSPDEENLIEISDWKHQNRYKRQLVTNLKAGWEIAIPPSNIQFLRLRWIKAKLVKDLAAAIKGDAQQVKSAVNSIALQLNKEIYERTDHKGLLNDLVTLDARDARRLFGAGIPAVMNFVAILAPDYLEEIKDWDHNVYNLLRTEIIQNEKVKNLFSHGRIVAHTGDQPGTLGLSIVYGTGEMKRQKALVLILFSNPMNYVRDDGRVQVAINELGTDGIALDLNHARSYSFTDLIRKEVYGPYPAKRIIEGTHPFGIPFRRTGQKDDGLNAQYLYVNEIGLEQQKVIDYQSLSDQDLKSEAVLNDLIASNSRWAIEPLIRSLSVNAADSEKRILALRGLVKLGEFRLPVSKATEVPDNIMGVMTTVRSLHRVERKQFSRAIRRWVRNKMKIEITFPHKYGPDVVLNDTKRALRDSLDAQYRDLFKESSDDPKPTANVTLSPDGSMITVVFNLRQGFLKYFAEAPGTRSFRSEGGFFRDFPLEEIIQRLVWRADILMSSAETEDERRAFEIYFKGTPERPGILEIVRNPEKTDKNGTPYKDLKVIEVGNNEAGETVFMSLSEITEKSKVSNYVAALIPETVETRSGARTKQQLPGKVIFLAPDAGSVFVGKYLRDTIRNPQMPEEDGIGLGTKQLDRLEMFFLSNKTFSPALRQEFLDNMDLFSGSKRYEAEALKFFETKYKTDEHWKLWMDAVYYQIEESKLLEGLGPNAHVVVVDNYPDGFYTLLFKAIVEKKSKESGNPVHVNAVLISPKSENKGSLQITPEVLKERFGLSREEAFSAIDNFSRPDAFSLEVSSNKPSVYLPIERSSLNVLLGAYLRGMVNYNEFIGFNRLMALRPVMTSLLEDPDEQVRIAAAQALGEVQNGLKHHPQSIAALQKAAQPQFEKSEKVRAAAEASLRSEARQASPVIFRSEILFSAGLSGLVGASAAFHFAAVPKRSEVRVSWTRDPNLRIIAQSYSIGAARRPGRDPGIGKYTFMADQYERLKKAGVRDLILMPHFAYESAPYEPIDVHAANEDYIDWASVPEVLEHRQREKFLSELIAPENEQQRIHLEKVRKRERPVGEAAYDSLMNRESSRKSDFLNFISENSVAWLNRYAEIMALHEILGGSAIEWNADQIAAAKREPRYARSFGYHQYAQWIAYRQFGDAVREIAKQGGHIYFDIPFFRSKRFIYPSQTEEYFRDVRNTEAYPGVVFSGYVNERWTGLALYNEQKIKQDGYRFLMDPIEHWLKFFTVNGAKTGLRVDAAHFIFNFEGKLGNGEHELGEGYVEVLEKILTKYEALGMAEAFEGRHEVYQRHGFINLHGADSPWGDNWEQIIGHDDPRRFKSATQLITEVLQRFLGHHSHKAPVVMSWTQGTLEGDARPVRRMVALPDGRQGAIFDYREALPTDKDYAERMAYDATPYFRHREAVQRAYEYGQIHHAGSSLAALIADDANHFVKQVDAGHGSSRTEIYAKHNVRVTNGFTGQGPNRDEDTFWALPGLLLTTGRTEEAKSVLSHYSYSAGRIFDILENRKKFFREAVSYNDQLKSLEGKGDEFNPDRERLNAAIADLNLQITSLKLELERLQLEYNTQNGPVLFLRALKLYLRETGDIEFIRSVWPTASRLMDLYSRSKENAYELVDGNGHAFAVYKDEDGLIVSPPDLDTGRFGKLVEVNALWYSVADFVSQMEGSFGDLEKSQAWREQARVFKKSFNEKFWNEEQKSLFDAVDGRADGGAVRHYQILAVSEIGDFEPLLPVTKQKMVIERVEKELLTPLGIRTLSPRDDRYNPEDPLSGAANPQYVLHYLEALAHLQSGVMDDSFLFVVRNKLAVLAEALLTNPRASLPDAFSGGSHLDIVRQHLSPSESTGVFDQAILRSLTRSSTTALFLEKAVKFGLFDRKILEHWAQRTQQPVHMEVEPISANGKHHIHVRVYVPRNTRPEELTVQLWTHKEALKQDQKEWAGYPIPMRFKQDGGPAAGGMHSLIFEGEIDEISGGHEFTVRAARGIGSDDWLWEWNWLGRNVALKNPYETPESMLGRGVNNFIKYNLRTPRDGDDIFRRDGVPEIWAADWHWFYEQWGRDAFISLPGLLLTTGRHEEARRMIRNFAQYEIGGLIPNKIWDSPLAQSAKTQALLEERKQLVSWNRSLIAGPVRDENFRHMLQRNFDRMEEIDKQLSAHGLDYNNADASMWFLAAVEKYFQYQPDDTEFAKEIRPVVSRILEGYGQSKETATARFAHPFGHYEIIYADEDGLIVTPPQGTWMDAWPGGADAPVTPRNGKAVDINALYYSGLKFAADLESKYGSSSAAAEFNRKAAKVKHAFNEKFWNRDYKPGSGMTPLFDVINRLPDQNDPRRQTMTAYQLGLIPDKDLGDPHHGAIRPNMVIAVSHGKDLLLPDVENPFSPDRQKAVVDTADEFLRTAYGMRTLAAADSHYIGDYRARQDTGDQRAKDEAYHQGTVWPWLIGPFIDAYARVYPNSKTQIGKMMETLFNYPLQSPVKSIPEVFDGDETVIAGIPQRRSGGTERQAWSIAEVLRVGVEHGLLDRESVIQWNQSVLQPYLIEVPDAVEPIVVNPEKPFSLKTIVYAMPGIRADDLKVEVRLSRKLLDNWGDAWGDIQIIPAKISGSDDKTSRLFYETPLPFGDLRDGKYELTASVKNTNGSELWHRGNIRVMVQKQLDYDPEKVPAPYNVVLVNDPAQTIKMQEGETASIKAKVFVGAEAKPEQLEVFLLGDFNDWDKNRAIVLKPGDRSTDGSYIFYSGELNGGLKTGSYNFKVTAHVAGSKAEPIWSGGENSRLEVTARSEIRLVVNALATRERLSIGAEQEFLKAASAPGNFSDIQEAILREAAKEEYVDLYISAASIRQASAEQQFLETHADYSAHRTDTSRAADAKTYYSLRQELLADAGLKLNFALAAPYSENSSAAFRSEFLNYVNIVKRLRDEFPSQVEGNIRILTTQGFTKKDPDFFRQVARSGVAKTILLENEAAAQMKLGEFLRNNPNALVSGAMEFQSKLSNYKHRFIDSEVSLDTVFPVVKILSARLAPYTSIDAATLRDKLPYFIPGIVVAGRESFMITRAAMDWIYEGKVSQLFARMA